MIKRERIRGITGAILLAILPCGAWAEVMDKERTLPEIWSWAFGLGIAGFVCWRRSLALGAAVSLVTAFVSAGLLVDLWDPWVGPAILSEAGRGYVVQAYAAISLAVLCHAGGVAARLNSRRTSQPTDAGVKSS